MNISVRHNGTAISSYVIEYEREHKICTGIGQLNIVIAGNIPRTFEPWDTIDIYENGSFQVKYYVSTVTASQPSQTITLECQDKSKRLVDYFIPDQYTIDYPSYTGYWIKKFLTEAGITYQFMTSDIGVLISNNTSLGLTPAYEQVMQLLQLSGWYMFFDGNGVAKIGNLTSDFGNVKATYGKNIILSIAKISDDKMLRNRAVVWGAFDPIRREFSYADISTNTRWNYDRRDKRSMVVSNGNIPNRSSAFGIANKLLKEFSKITVEKHLTVAGASNRDLGDVVRVRSDVYNGTGMITTFGVHMSKDGLTTNMVLDERCPRLFGFFDFGDYVYVGTYGAGVWRKHIRFDHTWHNFSTGLQDLAITDLHINNEIFGSIAASGDMYYATSNEGPWVQYQIASLSSSLEDSVEVSESGVLSSGIVMTSFSGLMGRAVIVDRLTNNIKYGIDTYSGINYGDYFLSYSGIVAASGITNSGILAPSGVVSSGFRGWIVEINPFTSQSGVYPISVSGNFDIMVLDLENDGINDYVSVKAKGESIVTNGVAWNFGRHLTQPFSSTKDSNGFSVTSEVVDRIVDNSSGSIGFTQKAVTPTSLILYDNEISDEMEVVSIIYAGPGNPPKFVRNKLGRFIDSEFQTTITRDTTTSDFTDLPSATYNVINIMKTGSNTYRVFYWRQVSGVLTVYSQDWDAFSNTLSSPVSELVQGLAGGVDASGSHIFSTKDTAYLMFYYTSGASGASGSSTQTYLYVYMFSINLLTGASVADPVLEFEFPLEATSNTYFFSPANLVDAGGFDTVAASNLPCVKLGIFQSEDGEPRVVGWFSAHHQYLPNPFVLEYQASAKEYLITGSTSVLNVAEFYANTAYNAIPERYWHLAGGAPLQLTVNKGVVSFGATSQAGDGYATLTTLPEFTFNLGTFPEHLEYKNTYPLLNTDNAYISIDVDGYYHLCNASELTVGGIIEPPLDYELVLPISTPLHSLAGESFFVCYNINTGKYVLVPFFNGVLYVDREIVLPANPSLSGYRCIQLGGFLVSEADWDVTDPTCRLFYVDMLRPYDNESNYLVLQRRGTDFHIIQESAKPIRVDISNSSPLLTVLDNENTFQSHFIMESELTTFYPTGYDFISSPPSGVRDYRYTMLEVPSGVIASGILETISGYQGVGKIVLYAIGSGINYTYTDNLSSGYMQVYTVASGLVERIETSNYVASGQYVFVTTSGDSPDFYQKDPMSDAFISYSGLPDFRATIIRLDDRI